MLPPALRLHQLPPRPSDEAASSLLDPKGRARERTRTAAAPDPSSPSPSPDHDSDSELDPAGRPKLHRCSFPGCSHASPFPANIRAHERTHTGEKPFTCPTCGTGFALKVTLERHASVHTGVRAHYCRYCPFSAKHTSDITKHERTHTGHRPFRCSAPGCAFAAAKSSNAWTHIRKVHNDLLQRGDGSVQVVRVQVPVPADPAAVASGSGCDLAACAKKRRRGGTTTGGAASLPSGSDADGRKDVGFKRADEPQLQVEAGRDRLRVTGEHPQGGSPNDLGDLEFAVETAASVSLRASESGLADADAENLKPRRRRTGGMTQWQPAGPPDSDVPCASHAVAGRDRDTGAATTTSKFNLKRARPLAHAARPEAGLTGRGDPRSPKQSHWQAVAWASPPGRPIGGPRAGGGSHVPPTPRAGNMQFELDIAKIHSDCEDHSESDSESQSDHHDAMDSEPEPELGLQGLGESEGTWTRRDRHGASRDFGGKRHGQVDGRWSNLKPRREVSAEPSGGPGPAADNTRSGTVLVTDSDWDAQWPLPGAGLTCTFKLSRWSSLVGTGSSTSIPHAGASAVCLHNSVHLDPDSESEKITVPSHWRCQCLGDSEPDCQCRWHHLPASCATTGGGSSGADLGGQCLRLWSHLSPTPTRTWRQSRSEHHPSHELEAHAPTRSPSQPEAEVPVPVVGDSDAHWQACAMWHQDWQPRANGASESLAGCQFDHVMAAEGRTIGIRTGTGARAAASGRRARKRHRQPQPEAELQLGDELENDATVTESPMQLRFKPTTSDPQFHLVQLEVASGSHGDPSREPQALASLPGPAPMGPPAQLVQAAETEIYLAACPGLPMWERPTGRSWDWL